MSLKLNAILIITFAFLLGILLTYCLFDRDERYDVSTLMLVTVIFRHGNKNPEITSLYPSNAYYDEKYYPEGYGQLTKAGIKTEYRLGIALRKRYGYFLGSKWNIKLIEARSSEYNRTKMSLELVLAGLFPPEGAQAWFSLGWQPIPYNYVSRPQDKELLPFIVCPNFEKMTNDLENASEMAQMYNEILKILAENTIGIMDFENAFFLFNGFVEPDELGLPLDEWTKAGKKTQPNPTQPKQTQPNPQPLTSLAIDRYRFIITNTTALRRIAAGYFLKKVLADTKVKIDGTLKPAERKMFLYAGHEINLAPILLTLDALKVDHMPPYGSYISFELHNIAGVYGLKLFYQKYEQQGPIPLNIPGCDHFCPYEDFYRLVEKILPTRDEECFGSS